MKQYFYNYSRYMYSFVFFWKRKINEERVLKRNLVLFLKDLRATLKS